MYFCCMGGPPLIFIVLYFQHLFLQQQHKNLNNLLKFQLSSYHGPCETGDRKRVVTSPKNAKVVNKISLSSQTTQLHYGLSCYAIRTLMSRAYGLCIRRVYGDNKVSDACPHALPSRNSDVCFCLEICIERLDTPSCFANDKLARQSEFSVLICNNDSI